MKEKLQSVLLSGANAEKEPDIALPATSVVLEQLIASFREEPSKNDKSSCSIADCLAAVDAPAGREALRQHLDSLPFPHYEAVPDRPGCLLRIDESGARTIGQFESRRFIPTEEE